MKITAKRIAAAALVTTALGTAIAIVPSYAQDAATTTAATEVAQLHARMGGGQHIPEMLAHAAELTAKFDTDGNGVVTQAEIDAVRAAELAAFDANGDGVLNLEEYQALWLARFYERMVDAFQELDANGDGTVTAEEFNAGLANIVARLDNDGDGALGPTDRPERPDMRTGPRGGVMIFGPGGPGGR